MWMSGIPLRRIARPRIDRALRRRHIFPRRFVRQVAATFGPFEEKTMQFVLFIYQGSTPIPGSERWNALPEGEQKRIYADYAELNKTPGMTPGLPLASPNEAKTVRVANGRAKASDGPYAGEAAGGYFVLEAKDLDAAIEVASRIPAARLGGAVEVRPVSKSW
jgi:hypothetical protein